MIYRIVHDTSYHYRADVSLSHSLAHLAARSTPSQTRLRGDFRVSVAPAVLDHWTDYFGNPVTFFAVQEAHRHLRVTAINEVDVHPVTPPDPAQTLPWEQVRDLLRQSIQPDDVAAFQFTFDSANIRVDNGLAAFAADAFPAGRPILERALALTHQIYSGFTFDPTATTLSTPLFEILALRRGVCQDFAHLMIAALRSLGLAARYVSGYLRTFPPPGRARLIGADVSHAWVSVYCPPFGWVDVDPTNDLIPALDHITLAWGRDYDDVSPIKGVILGGGRHVLNVGVDVDVIDPTTDRPLFTD